MASSRYPHRKGVDPSPLGQPLPLAFSGRTAKTRFLKAAMSEHMASWSPTDRSAHGIPGDDLVNLYRTWGEGGFGVVLTGNILIDHDHIEAPGNMIISVDSPFSGPRFDGYSALASAGKADGSLFIGQINHPGRQATQSIQPDPVSASDVQLTSSLFGEGFGKPHPATLDEIRHITDSFVHAAVFLDKAGFDGIQLHGAHGYLLAQFLSETTNLRTDAYGGSLENRARLITEIADRIRAETRPDFVLGIKINSVEFQSKGFTVDEAARLCELLEDHTFDFVELSGGTYEELGMTHRRESTKVREAFFLEFADNIVPRLNRTKAFITGGLRTAGAMVDALKTVHGIGLGRPVATEPYLPRDILSGEVKAAIQPLGIDDNDFGVTAALAGAQIKLVGKGLDPLDSSAPETVKMFKEAMAAWGAALAEKKGGDLFDHLKLNKPSRAAGRENGVLA
ncbi:FMN-linked oxidoreductase [Diplogelasinospora grovesii]|uniref:FMN-linked oxidoreductase n=1 Tax=Diplogelasinospora grovesii TaxID=303347 RepID=A0AAN6RZ00_9PEZI|nr:FMN-linked oxidoreductase [Diplogelasinospora grovesii]